MLTADYMTPISVYIIAYNEEEKIKEAIESVTWADEVLLVDSYSTDNTVVIAEELGATVMQVEFKGFGDLRNRAIAACKNDWIFSLDSDERCTPETREEIISLVSSEHPTEAYYIPRKNKFMGKWIKHSGFYPDYRQPQLFKKGSLVFEPDMVHERYTINSSKPAGYLQNPIWQIPFRNFEELIHKANRYSTLGAERLSQEGGKASIFKAFGHGCWTFVSLYFIKKGFLDGWPGFMIGVGNFLGTFFKYAKLYAMQNEGE